MLSDFHFLSLNLESQIDAIKIIPHSCNISSLLQSCNFDCVRLFYLRVLHLRSMKNFQFSSVSQELLENKLQVKTNNYLGLETYLLKAKTYWCIETTGKLETWHMSFKDTSYGKKYYAVEGARNNQDQEITGTNCCWELESIHFYKNKLKNS